jgi:hypothetical protein
VSFPDNFPTEVHLLPSLGAEMAGPIKPILKIDARKIDKDFLGMKVILFWVLNLSMENLVSPLC